MSSRVTIATANQIKINQKIRQLKLESHGVVKAFYLLFTNLPSIAIIFELKSFFPVPFTLKK